MAEADALRASARRDWYREVVEGDPDRRARFAEALERARTSPGTPDDLDEIARMLGADG